MEYGFALDITKAINRPYMNIPRSLLRGQNCWGFQRRLNIPFGRERGLRGYFAFFREPANWVVTDIQMPELDGVEMMRCI